MIDFSASGFASGIVTNLVVLFVSVLGGAQAHRLKIAWFRRRITRSFGPSSLEPEHCKVVIPHWFAREASRSETRFVKQLEASGPEHYYGPEKVLAADDMRAANDIAGIFQSVHKYPMVYNFDDEELAFEGRCSFLIGSPVSNLYARAIYEQDTLVESERVTFQFIRQPETEETGRRSYIENQRTGEQFVSDEYNDYALISRLRVKAGRDDFVFVCAGTHAAGTQGAARFLRDNWRMFDTGDDEISVVLLVNRERRSIPPRLVASTLEDAAPGR